MIAAGCALHLVVEAGLCPAGSRGHLAPLTLVDASSAQTSFWSRGAREEGVRGGTRGSPTMVSVVYVREMVRAGDVE